MPYDPKAPREVVEGSLDPINAQPELSQELLRLFQQKVLDKSYRQRLRRHHELFREELHRRTAPAPPASPSPREVRPRSPGTGIPAAHRERFREVRALLQHFGQRHLDEELTGFVLELWTQICRRKWSDCLRGQPAV
jgi:hypothetical protein